MNNFPYESIINMDHHKSSVHPLASRHDRASRFMPFAAISGYDSMVNEAAKEIEKVMDQNLQLKPELK